MQETSRLVEDELQRMQEAMSSQEIAVRSECKAKIASIEQELLEVKADAAEVKA